VGCEFVIIEINLKTINDIDDSIKITLGPTGKNGIVANSKNEIKFITTGALLLKSLEFSNSSSNLFLCAGFGYWRIRLLILIINSLIS
jgi:chaperonin GroEL (HSP60 family)